jgi:hypothetical protein
MSRTTPPRLLLLMLLALAAAPAGPAAAAAPSWTAADAAPQALPPAAAPRPAAPGAAPGGLGGPRPTRTTTRLARAHGATALRLPGAYAVPARAARPFATALRRRGLLRWSELDRPLTRLSAYEDGGLESGWARGPVVAAGLTPPATFAPIGVLDDVVDTSVADVAQAKVVPKSPRTTLEAGAQAEEAHGTEVASVAAARADGSGVIGIAPGAPLLSWGFRAMSCEEVVQGLLAVVDAGAKVINMSFAVQPQDEQDCHAFRLAVASAVASDVVLVAAAGNELQAGNPIVYPAAYPHVLSVGALGLDLQPTYFSSTGSALDLAAPGASVPVAVPPALDRDGTADGVTRADGTSFAAPIVSGVASWLRGARPKLTAGQYADLLRASAKDVADPGWDASTGFGLVDLAAALRAPTPPVDGFEPNDGISYVDGTVFAKPDAYIWTGGAPRSLRASVDPVEDPLDVFRIRLGARKAGTIRLTPSAGNADLRLYSGATKEVGGAPLAKSSLGAGRTDMLTVRNRTARARTYYVAVVAPGPQPRTVDAPYALTFARRR